MATSFHYFCAILQASNTLIAFLSSGVGGLLNLLFLPNISMASDRYRSRRGRRIPFLFWSTPVAALALIGIGFSQDVALWLHGTVGALHVFSPARMTLFIVAMLVILYAMFLMITNNVYQFLLRDVVPQSVMPWFLSMFRIIGVMAGCLFQWFLFRYIVDHPKTLCMGVGLDLSVVLPSDLLAGERRGISSAIAQGRGRESDPRRYAVISAIFSRVPVGGDLPQLYLRICPASHRHHGHGFVHGPLWH